MKPTTDTTTDTKTFWRDWYTNFPGQRMYDGLANRFEARGYSKDASGLVEDFIDIIGLIAGESYEKYLNKKK